MISTQMRLARAALGWGVRELAIKAGVSPNTISRIENGEDAKRSTLAAIHEAFVQHGITFEVSKRGLGIHVIPDTTIKRADGTPFNGSWPSQQENPPLPPSPKMYPALDYFVTPNEIAWDDVKAEVDEARHTARKKKSIKLVSPPKV